MPVNVTLLFSCEQYVAAAEAYLRGIERRIAAGLDPHVASVASLFVSRWDKAVAGKVPADLDHQPRHGGREADIRAYRDAARVRSLAAPAERAARARSGSSGPAPARRTRRRRTRSTSRRSPRRNTVNTMPEKTLLAFADHGEVGAMLCPPTAATPRRCSASSASGASTCRALAADLQKKGAAAFVASWNDAPRVHRRQAGDALRQERWLRCRRGRSSPSGRRGKRSARITPADP